MPLETIGPIYTGTPGYSEYVKYPSGQEFTGRGGSIAPMQFYERRVTSRGRKPQGTWLYPLPYERTTHVTRHKVCKWGSDGSLYDPYYRYVGVPQEAGSICENVAVPSVSSNEINRVVTNALLKLKDQKVNLAQAFAERKMTANLLADSITRIAKSVQALRSGKWRRAGRYLKQNWKKAPSSWLEYQYGWTPLLQDIYGSCEALMELDRTAWIMTVKEVFSARSEEVIRHTSNGNGSIHPFMYDSEQSLAKSRGAFIRLDYIPSATFFDALSRAGFTNPLQLQWELVPFSFVVDWGYAVGDWLSVMDATVGWEFYSGSLTTRGEVTSKVTLRVPPPDPYGRRKFPNPEGTLFHRKRTLRRVPYGSSPLPSRPVYKDPTSMTHVANALALLSQVLKPGPVRVR